MTAKQATVSTCPEVAAIDKWWAENKLKLAQIIRLQVQQNNPSSERPKVFKGFELQPLCDENPEAYSAYKDSKQVGSLRLTNNVFTVRVPNCEGIVIYKTITLGDEKFEEHERVQQLTDAIDIIIKAMHQRPGLFKDIQ